MKTELEMARHNETQQAYFARSAKPTMVPRDTPYVQRQIDRVLEAIHLTPGDRVLEIGCGMGRYTLPLVRRGVAVEGLDLTRELLERLRGFAGGQSVPVHCADVVAPPPSLHRSFDAVIGFFTLHHLHDLDASFASMAGLLKDGGRVAFVEPNPWNALYYLQIAFSPGMTWEGDKGIVTMRPRILFEAMRRAGLEPGPVQRFGFFPPFLANRTAFQKIERTIESARVFDRVLPFQLFTARLP